MNEGDEGPIVVNKGAAPPSISDDACAKEAIHLIESIQQYGYMVVCDRSGKVRAYSENISDLMNEQVDLSCASINDIIVGVQECSRVFQSAIAKPPEEAFDVFVGEGGLPCEMLVHASNNTPEADVIVELIPYRLSCKDIDNQDKTFDDLATAMQKLEASRDLVEFSESSVKLIRKFIGYDRVMMYRFNGDWSGEVIAEACSEKLSEHFLGLRFPESDIPAQARELYKKNHLRVIASVSEAPKALISTNAGRAPVDMSFALLRQPSQMHIQYLKNMGVESTFTISILRGNELWGMIACHHYQKIMPLIELRNKMRLMVKLIGYAINSQLNTVLQIKKNNEKLERKEFFDEVRQKAISFSGFIDALPKLLEKACSIINASTACVYVKSQWVSNSDVSADEWRLLVRENADSAWHTNKQEDLPCILADKHYSGVLFEPVACGDNACIVFLRKEQVRRIRWGGNPYKKLEIHDGELSPRSSFQRWSETLAGTSEMWHGDEIKFVKGLAELLTGILTELKLKESQEALIMLGDSLSRIHDMVVILGKRDHNAFPHIEYANTSFVNNFGFEDFEIIGTSFEQFFLSVDHKINLTAENTIRENKSVFKKCLQFKKKNNETFYGEMSISPIVGDDQNAGRYVVVIRDVSEQKKSQDKIKELAYFDTLTGLLNRYAFFDRFESIKSESDRKQWFYAVIYIDLDRFKALNDSKGHSFGDELLVQLSRRLRSCMRDEDVFARIGGDEFVVLIHGYESEMAAEEAADILSKKISNEVVFPFDVMGYRYRIGCSIGVAVSGQDYSATVNDIVKRADIAMYRAKTTGRGKVCFFDESIQSKLALQSQLEQLLRSAVVEGDLCVYYQPIVNANQQLVGYEALSRWFSKHNGTISPEVFIPLAERSDVIARIGQNVLDDVLKVLRDSERQGDNKWHVSINVSPREIVREDFVERLLTSIARYNVDPRRLVIELTETLVLDNLDVVVEVINTLSEVGVQFALDDFGTGYSSLAYLKKLPITKLKIDRSFVHDIVNNEESQAISHLIVNLAKTIGREVVAEGVESYEQHELLKSFGCDFFQGYVFGKAAPICA